jgi:hypothetical protein
MLVQYRVVSLVSAWTDTCLARKAFDVTARERVVIICQHDDRHRGSRRSSRLQRDFRAVRDEHVRLRGDHLVGSGERLRQLLVGAAIFQLMLAP